MNVLFLFLDGVGLGEDNPAKNPFASANFSTFNHFFPGLKLLAKNAPFKSRYCTLLSIDAQMGVPGLPQSATGQATLLTGLNFPEILGYHYGPKPNPEIIKFFELEKEGILQDSKGSKNISIFSHLSDTGKKASLLNAYPPAYFLGVKSRKRNHSVIPLAVSSSGISLFDQNDLRLGKALSADFTGQGWLDHLNIRDTPIIEPIEAGMLLAKLAKVYHFSMFEFWESDLIGHKQNFSKAREVIEKIDLVLEGLLINWDLDKDGILITSDHGNMEDLSTRRHTDNPVPAIFIGPPAFHQNFSKSIRCIGDIAPFIIKLLDN